MDVLSDVISTVRTGQPHSARIEWYAPYGMRFPEIPRSEVPGRVAGFVLAAGGRP